MVSPRASADAAPLCLAHLFAMQGNNVNTLVRTRSDTRLPPPSGRTTNLIPSKRGH